jgi:hypothetical protein
VGRPVERQQSPDVPHFVVDAERDLDAADLEGGFSKTMLVKQPVELDVVFDLLDPALAEPLVAALEDEGIVRAARIWRAAVR